MTVTTTRMGLGDFFAYTSDLDTLYELSESGLTAAQILKGRY